MSPRARRIGLLSLAVLLTAAIAWSPPGVSGQTTEVDAKLLTSQKRLPGGVFRSIGRLALTPVAYRRLWERFRLRGDPPQVPFRSRVVLFAGTGESGSCPLLYRGLLLNGDRATYRIKVKRYEGVCTADWTPRTMVISVPRRDVPHCRLHARFGGAERFRVKRARI